MPRLHLAASGASTTAGDRHHHRLHAKHPALGEHLRFKRFIAKGTFGQVYFAETEPGGAVLAVKVTQPARHPAGTFCSREEQIQRYLLVQHELAAERGEGALFDLLSLRIPAAVERVSSPRFAGKKFMLFPHFGKALDLMLPLNRAADRRFVAQQVLRGLTLLHSLKPFAVCHRDLKPSNVVVDPVSLQCKLIDFGASKLVRGEKMRSSPLKTGLPFRAPELLCGAKEYSLKVDIWSAGMLLLDIGTDGTPFLCATEPQMLVQVVALLGNPLQRDVQGMNLPPEAVRCFHKLPRAAPISVAAYMQSLNGESARVDLTLCTAVKRALRWNPKERPSAAQLLQLISGDGGGCSDR